MRMGPISRASRISRRRELEAELLFHYPEKTIAGRGADIRSAN